MATAMQAAAGGENTWPNHLSMYTGTRPDQQHLCGLQINQAGDKARPTSLVWFTDKSARKQSH